MRAHLSLRTTSSFLSSVVAYFLYHRHCYVWPSRARMWSGWRRRGQAKPGRSPSPSSRLCWKTRRGFSLSCWRPRENSLSRSTRWFFFFRAFESVSFWSDRRRDRAFVTYQVYTSHSSKNLTRRFFFFCAEWSIIPSRTREWNRSFRVLHNFRSFIRSSHDFGPLFVFFPSSFREKKIARPCDAVDLFVRLFTCFFVRVIRSFVRSQDFHSFCSISSLTPKKSNAVTFFLNLFIYFVALHYSFGSFRFLFYRHFSFVLVFSTDRWWRLSAWALAWRRCASWAASTCSNRCPHFTITGEHRY